MSRTFCPARTLLGAIAMAGFATGTPVEAAILTLDGVERITSIVTSPVDLTAMGSVDWAYWAPNTGTVVTVPVAPTNEKIGGAAISSVESAGGVGLRGSTTSSTVERYSWTDGTSPAAGTNASLAGLIFSSPTGSSANGTGWKLSIAGDPAQERIVTLYLGGFAATGNLTLTLAGIAVPITHSQPAYPNSAPKQMDVYTLRFQPDSASDLLQVQYTASAITDTVNGHVGLQAVTVAAVPEPGTASLLFLAGLVFCRRRRA